MAGTIQNQSSQAIAPLIDRILNIGQLSRLEHLQLVSTILSDYKVTDEERSQINRVFDELQIGRLKLVS
ncbi:MAG TPA: hypothetical protein DCL61_03230 [Cyanobacteria bacterium UBA12227]|nr:hypothetical protein [Cyanobacteria bacterium UBA12227]HAX86540.1 hypothetical protein [Cyanobacteria bacterium UBA11370]HBY80391.1 hypothetical protein [Cyanobacteria bacterium UBA11148]